MEQQQQINRFTWQQSMLRVKDYKASVEFYTKYFNMTVIDSYDFPQWKFQLYFLTVLPENVKAESLPKAGTQEAHDYLWTYEGVVLELTYNQDTEKNPDFKYHPGNTTISETQKDGFGHIAFHCDDVYALCEQLEKDGVKFQKKPDEGRMKGLAFALDPDGYWVEIIKRAEGSSLKGITFGQTMLRVKDAQKSIKFYTEICQMKLINERHFDDFSLYFLATIHENSGIKLPSDTKSQEASTIRSQLFNPVLELTHNHGTEKIEEFSYLSGNTEPYKGFGHTGFLVDDVYKATETMLKEGVQFQKKPDEGGMKGLAFAKDPDGYWVELVKRGGLKF